MNAFGAGDTGVGESNVTWTAGCGRRNTSVPLTGPRHVVPVKGATSDGPVGVFVLPLAAPSVELGPSTLRECSKPQPTVTTAAAASAPIRDSGLFILQTCAGAHISARSARAYC